MTLVFDLKSIANKITEKLYANQGQFFRNSLRL
jgi:hypothetical protein